MRVIFAGTPSYATCILDALLKSRDIEVVCVVTQMDKKVGRKQILTPPDVKRYLQEKNINVPIYQPKSLKDEGCEEYLRNFEADFMVVAAYGQILPANILDVATCINLHASILPAYRGASPIQAALMDGLKETGVTAMLMDIGMDTGDILRISTCRIEEGEKADELYEKLSKIAADLTLETLRDFDNIVPIEQKNSEATYCKKITRGDALIDFNLEIEEIYNKYRAFYPWPGLHVKSGLKVLQVKKSDEKYNETNIGKIAKISKDKISITCKGGVLDIMMLQAPSKKAGNAGIYAKNRGLEVGKNLV